MYWTGLVIARRKLPRKHPKRDRTSNEGRSQRKLRPSTRMILNTNVSGCVFCYVRVRRPFSCAALCPLIHGRLFIGHCCGKPSYDLKLYAPMHVSLLCFSFARMSLVASLHVPLQAASNTKATTATTAATMVPAPPLDGGEVDDSGDIHQTCSDVASAATGNSSRGGELEGAEQRADPGPAAAAGAAALLLAAAAAETLGGDDGNAASESLQRPHPSVAAAPGGRDGTSANPEGSPSPSSSYSIPKLKISIKPQQPQSPSPQASDGGGAIAGAGEGNGEASGSSKSRAGLKLVLKGPALSSAGSGAGASTEASAGGAGTRASPGGGAGKKRGRQQAPKQRQRQQRRWKEDYEDSDEFADGDSSDDDDEEEEEEEEEEDEGESGDDNRIGRGGKRKARPLGSRLRAIARLGDDAAGGGSEDDDSADEYKPDADVSMAAQIPNPPVVFTL